LGAKLQQGNADQLVNTFLFGNSATFHGASFPGQHTFLLKWPLFFLIKLFGSTPTAFLTFTVIVAVITISALAYMLYRIEKRPLVFGTLCLALASVLLLVPAQPYPGGLLPVNMAMLATRNLEYILYIASLAILIRSPRLRTWSFWLGVAGMTLLIASDKLFLSISLGGALLALVVYTRAHSWSMANSAVNWLIASVASVLGAAGVLAAISASGLTHVAGRSGAGPYALVHSAHNLALGAIYAVLGLFTNFGANPAFDATRLRDIPGRLVAHLISVGGLAFLVNAVLLGTGLVMATHIIHTSLTQKKNLKARFDNYYLLSVTLIWSTLATLGSFVVNTHDYVVDTRYLTIGLFALFIAAAAYTHKKSWPPEKISLIGLVLVISVLLGLPSATQTYTKDRAALATANERNAVISQVLSYRPERVLVGDYWRVLPARLASKNKQSVMPLVSCTKGRSVLSSKTWQPDLNHTSFAYLLSLDGSLTDYPKCSLKQVTAAYGRPNASFLVAGSLSKPKELLLFYDHGAHKSAPKADLLTKSPATVVPIPLDQLPYTTCPVPTSVNIVAHQDDDLLFMNPDILHDIQAGHCVRTIYMTAGDAGGQKFYWLGREHGSESAYSRMLGSNAIWVQRIVELSSHEFVTVANPRGNARISLIFMYLPDGNIKGEGFKASRNESLAKLSEGKIGTVHSVDGQSSYSSGQLTAALSTLLHTYLPTTVRTQANYISAIYPDHSDHLAVGTFVKRAYKQFEDQQYGGQVVIPIKFYTGYPIHQMPANVTGPDLITKESAFIDYAKFDGGVCQSLAQCQQSSTYGSYLTREYQNPY
jgi:LmbE family N-acetylglucosaminyl deacetylase